MGMFDNLKGIYLGEDTRWVVKGFREFESFFRHLDQLLPATAAIVYLEGPSIAADVRSFLEEHSVEPWHEVYPGTVWPKPSVFHLPASLEILRGLAELASHHAYPEIADHCHVYTRDGMILQWYDACDPECPLGIAQVITEEKVRAFCDLTKTEYCAYESG